MTIRMAHTSDYDEIVRLWEASVRASHDFLSENAIAELRVNIARDYLPVLRVHCFLDPAGVMQGFVADAGDKIEMLFIAPDARGTGIGKALLTFALSLGCRWVDVNEQNPHALHFYQKMGFEVTGRSPFDGQGNPFPLLHMQHPG